MKVKFTKRMRVVSFMILLVFLVVSCAPVLTVTDADIAGRTAMSVIYDQTFGTIKGAWATTAWVSAIVLGIACAMLAYKILEMTGSSGVGCVGAFATFFIVGLVVFGIFSLIGTSSAEKGAAHALSVGADTGKTRKANQFVEKIHVRATRPNWEIRECHESDSGTGCRFYWTYDYNFQTTCTDTHDSEGNKTGETCTTTHDTRYVPYFTQEWRFSANFAMPDKFLSSKVCLEFSGEDKNGDGKEDCAKFDDAHTGLTKSDIPNNPVKFYYDARFDVGGSGYWEGDNYAWQAPEEYNVYLWGPSNRDSWESYTVPAVPHQIPGEWKAIKAALNSGRPYIATFKHDYVNWVFASDAQNLMAQSSQIQKYRDLGVLPVINMPYSRYGSAETFALDYDFVQFLGGVQVANPAEWQESASFTALNVGPYLEGSMLVFFAPANLIDNPDAWVDSAKAFLSDKNTFGMTLLPKNLVLIGCGVDQGTQMIQFCRMRTGMPSGNVEIGYTIDHLAPMPFTVQSVFGTPVATATPRADGFYDTVVAVPQDGFMRLLFGRSQAQLVAMSQDEDIAWKVPWFQSVGINTDGFGRVSMTELDWLKTDMKLEAVDINWVLETETKGAISSAMWAMIICIVIAGLLVALTFADQMS